MIFAKTLKNIRRSPYQTSAAMLIMLITFFMVSVFTILAFISQSILVHFETKPQVSAFYPNDTQESEILAIKKRLEDTGLAKEVKYISSKDAVAIYKKDIAPDTLDTSSDIISDKVLPPSLEITAYTIDDLRILRNVVKEKEGVDIVFIEDIVNKLSSWLTGIRLGGLILLALLFVESILVIWTIIAMRISQRQEEIEVMKLLGATNWFIRAPFVIEGMIYGISGAFFGVLITFALLQFSLSDLTSFLKDIPILPLNPQNFIKVLSKPTAQTALNGIPLSPISPLFIAMLFGFEAIIGAIVGALGSWMSIKRNLNK